MTSLTASQASQSRCFTNMRVRMVSGFKLALRREMTSLPLDKIRSTATAEPRRINIFNIYNSREIKSASIPGILIKSRPRHDRFGNCARHAPHHLTGSHSSTPQAWVKCIPQVCHVLQLVNGWQNEQWSWFSRATLLSCCWSDGGKALKMKPGELFVEIRSRFEIEHKNTMNYRLASVSS